MAHRRIIAGFAGILLIAGLGVPSAGAASLAAIKERGMLRVCAHPDALPFSSQNRNPPGFQLEIADAIAKALGVRVSTDWIVLTRQARRLDCDVVIGAVIPLSGGDAGPKPGVLLSKPYAASGYVLLVPRADTAVHRAEDVKSGKVGVEYTSWPHYALEQRGVPVSAYVNQVDIIEAVAKGEVAAGMVTDSYLGWFLKEHPEGAVKVADGYVREPEFQWNIAVRLLNADPALREAVDRALEGLVADRTIPEILTRYGITYLPPIRR